MALGNINSTTTIIMKWLNFFLCILDCMLYNINIYRLFGTFFLNPLWNKKKCVLSLTHKNSDIDFVFILSSDSRTINFKQH